MFLYFLLFLILIVASVNLWVTYVHVRKADNFVKDLNKILRP